MRHLRRRRLIRRIAALCVALLLLLPLCVRAYVRLPHLGYFSASSRAFRIPAIHDGFVPQGLAYDPESEVYLVTGYQKAGGPSPLFLVGRDGAVSKTLYFVLEDDTPYTGHAGGIALRGAYLYLAGGHDAAVHVFSASALAHIQDGSPLRAIGRLSCVSPADRGDHLGPAFLCATEQGLVVGEFYRGGNYETPESHRVVCPSGAVQRALALVYPADPAAALGVASAPAFALSLPDLAQGMAVADGWIAVTASWGLSHSSLYLCDAARLPRAGDVTVLGCTLPCYALEPAACAVCTSLPPMAEEPTIVDGALYVMNESASDLYFFGKLTGGQYCYATPLSFFLEP